MKPHFFKVAVNVPLFSHFTYESEESYEKGDVVLVPFRNKEVQGVILEPTEKPDLKIPTKKILGKDPVFPSFSSPFMDWALWLSDYYDHPVGQVFKMFFPPSKKSDKKLEEGERKKEPPSFPLTHEQEKCVFDISKSLDEFSVHFLFGVTGSGKTRVYMSVMNELIKKGKSCLFLVPEISLTPQLIQRFSSYFPNEIAVIHSQLTPRQKTNAWWSVVEGRKKILIGARSCLFCPVDSLGLIVVDEEHESSFKQEEKLKYQARDSAIMLAKKKNIPVILGSATPSLESWLNVSNKRYHLHEMKKRIHEIKMPEITVIHMKKEKTEKKDEMPFFWMSGLLNEKIKKTLEKKEQVALFLNRRGVAQTTQCQDCGHIEECPNCSVSLTLHGKKYLVCHYCVYSTELDEHCPECKSENYEPLGLGTERIEKDIRSLFPEARVARADRDEVGTRKQLEDLIEKMDKGEIDILIGTQMISKGLDFKNLTLVGVVLADVGFHIPDFRSNERIFQTLTQVAGRAGRSKDKLGEVIIQTYNPSHPSIQCALNHDFENFSKNELTFRKNFLYPPYSRFVCFRIEGLNAEEVKKTADLLKEKSERLKKAREEFEKVLLKGPAPCPIYKIKKKFRHQFFLQSPTPLTSFVKRVLGDRKWIPRGVQIKVDVDPYSML